MVNCFAIFFISLIPIPGLVQNAPELNITIICSVLNIYLNSASPPPQLHQKAISTQSDHTTVHPINRQTREEIIIHHQNRTALQNAYASSISVVVHDLVHPHQRAFRTGIFAISGISPPHRIASVAQHRYTPPDDTAASAMHSTCGAHAANDATHAHAADVAMRIFSTSWECARVCESGVCMCMCDCVCVFVYVCVDFGCSKYAKYGTPSGH